MKKLYPALICLLWSVSVMAAPDLAGVSAGSAFVTQNAAQTLVQQTTDKAVLNWNNFDVASDHHVIFQQPNAGSFTLNRVPSFLFPTYIDGRITANGSIAIVNPQGIFIGPSGVIQSAGFIASTHDILDSDVMDTDNVLNFNIAPFSPSIISNQGRMEVSTNGKIIIQAPSINMNGGYLKGNRSLIALTNADSMIMDLSQGLNQLNLVLSGGDISVQNSSIVNVGEGDVNIIAGNSIVMDNNLIQSTGGDIHIESVSGDIVFGDNVVVSRGGNDQANVDIGTFSTLPYASGSAEEFVELLPNNVSETGNGGDIVIRSARILGDGNCIQSGNINCLYQGQALKFVKDDIQIHRENKAQSARHQIEEKTKTFSHRVIESNMVDSDSLLDIQINNDSSNEE